MSSAIAILGDGYNFLDTPFLSQTPAKAQYLPK